MAFSTLFFLGTQCFFFCPDKSASSWHLAQPVDFLLPVSAEKILSDSQPHKTGQSEINKEGWKNSHTFSLPLHSQNFTEETVLRQPRLLTACACLPIIFFHQEMTDNTHHPLCIVSAHNDVTDVCGLGESIVWCRVVNHSQMSWTRSDLGSSLPSRFIWYSQ